MALEFIEHVNLTLPKVSEQLSDLFNEAEKSTSPKRGLVVEIASIHEGLTQNHTFYTAQNLIDSLETWTTPYKKPVLLNHDPNGEIIGRVVGARAAYEEDGTPYIRLQAMVMDPTAIEKVLDGRYLTGSVGGKVESAKCNICGVDWALESAGAPCKHRRGQKYDDKIACLEMGGISWREYSFVAVPADQRSGIKGIGGGQESLVGWPSQWENEGRIFAVEMEEESILNITESATSDILLDFEEAEATEIYNVLKDSFLSTLIEEAAKDPKKPYGDVTYADPGYQEDGKKRYPLDSEDHCRAAWSYINQSQNASKYTPAQLKRIKSRIKSALKKYGADISDKKESIMPDQQDVETEDILAISDELSEDLSAAPEGQERPEGDPVGDNGEEDRETDGDQVDEENLEEEGSVTEEQEQGDEAPEGDEEQPEDEEVVEPETEDLAAELSAKITSLEAEIAALSEDKQTLSERVSKLETALKRNLAERVVDSKITLGLVEYSDRGAEVEEHLTRSAASLADSLRDLARMPMPKPKLPAEMEEKAGAVPDRGQVADEKPEAQESEEEHTIVNAEELFLDVLMGRKKL